VPADTLPPLTPADLGFDPIDPAASPRAQQAWRTTLRGRAVAFRLLHGLDDLAPVEAMQREVMGMSDLDVYSTSGLVIPAETGGHVLGAFVAGANGAEEMVGCLYAFGGFLEGRPRLVSDFMGVRAAERSWGLGGAMKRLQAAIGACAGFREVVWTVDPLRAANARLNFVKLGAYCDHHERNRYGESFAVGHYGGIPTDRLHMTLDLDSQRVRARLRGEPEAPAGPTSLRTIPIPPDIDVLMRDDVEGAAGWRFRVRAELEDALADGWTITHFTPASAEGMPNLVLERLARDGEGRPLIDHAVAGRAPDTRGAAR
jgi:predicted GNAT superfamily acetyltransferase